MTKHRRFAALALALALACALVLPASAATDRKSVV